MVRNWLVRDYPHQAMGLDEKFPMDTWRKMGDPELSGLDPEEYEGSGMDFISHAIVAESWVTDALHAGLIP